MAITQGTQATRGRLWDLTGAADYDSGSTPFYASIDGCSLLLRFGLSEYDADVLKLLSQNMRVTSKTLTYAGPQGSTYPLGKILDSTYYIPLLVADQGTKANRPALYVPRAIIIEVGNLSFDMATPVMDEATFVVGALYDETIGGPFMVGDIADFPSLT